MEDKMVEKMQEMAERMEGMTERKWNISCCRSYATPKGRCYTCPESEERDPDEERWH